MKNASNKIQALWIRAHGNPYTISLSKEEDDSLSEEDVGRVVKNGEISINSEMLEKSEIDETSHILKKYFDNLEAQAPIILESCATAGKMNKKNIAQFIAEAADNRVVYAPSRCGIGGKSTISYSQDKQDFEVHLMGIEEKSWFRTGSFLHRLKLIWALNTSTPEEVTAVLNAK